MSQISIEIKGVDRLLANLQNMRNQIKLYMGAAGREAGEHVLNQKGLRNYPPETNANKPPTPYWIRGRGLETASGNKGNSERYGTQFYVKAEGYDTKIGNRASYAIWLADEEKQAQHMAAIGWRKLKEVADEQIDRIKEIYQAWIDKLIKDYNL